MKIRKLLIGDIRFQYKYGFYFLYFVFTFLYVFVLKVIPQNWVLPLAMILVFSDPSAIGLIFSGAIIQLELSEKTFESLAISPIKPSEYLWSKLLSIAMISFIAACIIGLSVQVINNYLFFALAIILGSMIFTNLGLICAFKTHSLNQFFLTIVPVIILIVVPGCIHQFYHLQYWFIIHPGVAMVEMLNGGTQSIISSVVLLFWFYVLFILT
jgi:fluoroquinolone transport system permease protein